jgi:metal-responsive CopG/Arc/MetJ family transcriptional regulator
VPLRKTAIALPPELLDAVDRVARERHESRSRFVTHVLQQAVRARRDAEITRRMDALFADPAVAAEQRGSAAALDAAGTRWEDERW